VREIGAGRTLRHIHNVDLLFSRQPVLVKSVLILLDILVKTT